jgi:hypothetical protein
MPLLDGREWAAPLGVPAGLRVKDEVLHIRFTGEVFQSYE